MFKNLKIGVRLGFGFSVTLILLIVVAATCIVIVETGRAQDCDSPHDIGIMVDAVSEVIEIPASEIEPPPSFGAKMRADFIFGMGKVAGDFVIILNIDKVLSVEEIAQITGTEVGVAELAAAEVS